MQGMCLLKISTSFVTVDWLTSNKSKDVFNPYKKSNLVANGFVKIPNKTFSLEVLLHLLRLQLQKVRNLS